MFLPTLWRFISRRAAKLLIAGRNEDCIALTRRYLTLRPQDPMAWDTHAYYLRKSGLVGDDEIEDLHQEAVHRFPDHALLRISLGSALEARYRSTDEAEIADAARMHFEHARSTGDEAARTFMSLASLDELQGQHRSALENANRARSAITLVDDDDWVTMKALLAVTASLTLGRETALDWAREVHERYPDWPVPKAWIGLLMPQGDEAKGFLDEALRAEKMDVYVKNLEKILQQTRRYFDRIPLERD